MKIAIAGCGYVGLSMATLLSKKHNVVALDIMQNKVEMINKRVSPIKDSYIEKYLIEQKLSLKATTDYKDAFEGAEYIIICTPTNYDENNNVFDTSSVEDIIERVQLMEKKPTIIIKSTIPIGFTNKMRKKYKMKNIIFSPEFLREGKALYDNLYPSRIIVGEKSEEGKKFANILKEVSLKAEVEIKLMDSMEAEAVKLFSNTYLAMRVAYFNELDSFCEIKGLSSKDIIEGMGLDNRIGMHYNNPSFGYGGYCLPKDTKQLLASYHNIQNNLIKSIVESNMTRKKHIVKMVLERNPKVVGIYRLIMKKDSDNFRYSAIQDIIKMLKNKNIKILIYEPMLHTDNFDDCKVTNNFNLFSKTSDIIMANRWEEKLEEIKNKVYTRDIYYKDI